MKIDHEKNPFGIVKRFYISYNQGKMHLEGIIRAHTEEGFDEANWFTGKIIYPGGCEIGGAQLVQGYQELKKGFPTQKEAEEKMRELCRSFSSFGLTIYKEKKETVGVTR